MAVLDELSGFEFEDLMVDVFRNLGYENVRPAERIADEGRDVVMEEVVDGTPRAIVVECKHTATVGRPIVQKLHSAIATYDHDGPKRGMVVTTGRFTNPAKEYSKRLRESGDPYPIELVDGRDLRDIADEIGLDLYNGRIEILCEETLRPSAPATAVDAPVEDAFADVGNIDAGRLPDPHTEVAFRPVLSITAETDAVFETSVGVIHRIDERSRFVVRAGRGRPEIADADVASLVTEHLGETIDLEDDQAREPFNDTDERRFGQTKTEYKDWAVERLRSAHTSTVSYTGDNNVTYTRTCEPNRSDISVQSIDSVYLPMVRHTTILREYSYPYAYFAAGSSRVVREDGIHRCVHCDTDDGTEPYTFCTNCGAIACRNHVEIERLEGEPICTGCAVTDRFALKTKYFYDESNLEAFREEYATMSIHEKLMENKPLFGALLVSALLLGLGVLVGTGVI